MARPTRERAAVCLSQHCKLFFASDKRRIESPCAPRSIGENGDDAPRSDCIGLPPDLDRPERLCDYGVTDEPVGCLTDEDLTGCCQLLESRRDVHGVARGEGVPVTDDDLAGVEADSERDGIGELPVQLGERNANLSRGADRAQRVILVRSWDAKNRHDRVADVLLDGATVARDHGGRTLEVRGHERPNGLGIAGFAEGGRADDIGKEHSHCLPCKPAHPTSLGRGRGIARADGNLRAGAAHGGSAATMRGRVRQPFRQASGCPRRPS